MRNMTSASVSIASKTVKPSMRRWKLWWKFMPLKLSGSVRAGNENLEMLRDA